jgi:hypothetical protein
MKVFRVAAIRLEILPKIENKIIDGTGGRINIIAPNYL